MKVALLGLQGDFNNNAGAGIQKYMFNLYKNLKKLNEKHIKKIEISKLPIIGTGFSFSLKTFFLNLNEFDIVHHLMPLVSYSRPKILRNNIIVTTVHDFYFYPKIHLEYNQLQNISLKQKVWIKLISGPASENILLSDYLIANSSQTKYEAIKLGFEKNKVFTVNLGIDGRFSKGLKDKKENKIFKVGYLGGADLHKNLIFAINSMNLIKNNNIKLELWGNSNRGYNSLKNIIKNKNISLEGFAPENRIIGIYDSFDAFIFPSLFEGFGLPIIEAQARGLPVIIYKNGQISKEVRKYCFEAESPEHMAQLIENFKENGYNEKLKKKATEYARSFTWERCAKETLEVYKKVLKK